MYSLKFFSLCAVIAASSANSWSCKSRRQPHFNKLSLAIGVGDLREIQKIVRKNPESVNEISPYGYTGLHWALKWGRGNAAKFLIEHASLDTINLAEPENGETALHFAIKKRVKCLPELLAKGANVKALQKNKETPAHYAARYGDAQTIRTLLKVEDFTIDWEDAEGMTALLRALKCGRGFDVVRTLIDEGSSAVVSNAEGITTLHYAAHNCGVDTIELLLEKGAGDFINESDKLHHTPLLAAVVSSRTYRESGKESHFADLKYHPDRCGVIQCLINNKANVKVVHPETGNGLLYYVEEGKVARLLATKGAEINYFNKKGNSLLYEAVLNGRPLPVIRAMVHYGADLLAVNENGNRILHCEGLNRDVLIWLVGREASLLAKNNAGETPLMTARRRRRDYCDVLMELEI